MKIHTFKWLIAGALMLSGLAGCGGGDGGPAEITTFSGTASKGIIYPGTINVYALDAAGNKGALLAGPLATTINGKYSASLVSYSGAIVVEASGTYTDEITGNAVTIAPSAPLHAMADKVNWTTDNNRVIAVTPLTEIAWRKANSNGAKPTATVIATANRLVGDLFKVNDIIGTEPVPPDNADMSGASLNAQIYTLSLATISAMAGTASGATAADKLQSVIARMALEVASAETSGNMSTTATNDFITAMGTVPLSTDFPSAREQLSVMGRRSQTLTLSTSGTLPAGTKIYALQGSVLLPATVMIRTDGTTDNTTWKVSSYAFGLTGVASGMGTSVANHLKQQQQMAFSVMLDPAGPGAGIGDFAVLTYELASGATVSAADFSVIAGSVIAKDLNGADIPGVTVTLR